MSFCVMVEVVVSMAGMVVVCQVERVGLSTKELLVVSD